MSSAAAPAPRLAFAFFYCCSFCSSCSSGANSSCFSFSLLPFPLFLFSYLVPSLFLFCFFILSLFFHFFISILFLLFPPSDPLPAAHIMLFLIGPLLLLLFLGFPCIYHAMFYFFYFRDSISSFLLLFLLRFLLVSLHLLRLLFLLLFFHLFPLLLLNIIFSPPFTFPSLCP